MAVSSENARISYALDGVTTVFPVPFVFLAKADVRVVKTSSAGVETAVTSYTLTGAGNPSGGTCTLSAAGASGETLTILRDMALTQPLDLKPNDPFPAESLETALDRQCYLTQQMQAQMDRTLRFPETETPGAAAFLPSLAARKGKQAWFDAATGGLIGVDAAVAIETADLLLTDTVAQLRASDPTGFRVALTNGNRAAQDLGGGLWYWDAASTSTDDGAFVLKPDSVSGAGRWKRDLQAAALYITAFPDVKVNDAAFDNGPGFQAALDRVRGFGIELLVHQGSWYFQSGFVLQDDNKLTSLSMFNTHLIATGSAFNLVKLDNWGTWQECRLRGFTLTGYDDSDTDSIAVRIGDEAASTVDNNQCVNVSHITFGSGWNIGILCETEADNSEVAYCRSDQQFGQGWLKHLRSTTNSSGDTAGMLIRHNHISPTSRATWGKNFFGIWLEGAEATVLEQNIINNFDCGYRIWSTVSGSRPTMSTTIRGAHYEDLRDFVADVAARANSTPYAVNSVYRKSSDNGYVYRVTVAGTSAASAPTLPTTIGTTFTDGTMTVLCAGYHSLRWSAGRVVSVGMTCKPTKNNAGKCFTAVWECTTGGTTGGTEPTTWGTEYGDTVNDNGVVWTLRHKSVFVELNSQSATHVVRVEGCRTLKPLVEFYLKGKGQFLVSNVTNFDSTSRGGTDYAFCSGSLTGASFFKADASTLTGNIKPYAVAVTDTYTAAVTLDHVRVSNESLNHIRSDGDGLYACFSSLCEPDDGGVRSVSGTTDTVDFTKDKFVYYTSASATTVTVPAPNVSVQGRRVRIYANGTGGLTVNFASSVRFKGQDLTSVYMGRSGLWIEVVCVGTGYRVTDCGPAQQIELTNTQATGANGGNLTAGAWNTVTLNTENVDEGNNCALASSIFTLKPGVYEMTAASAVGYDVGRHRLRLWNPSGAGTSLATGPVVTTGTGVQNTATLGRNVTFTLTAETALVLQHYIESNGTTGEGLALNATSSPEVYAAVSLVKYL